MRIRSLVQSRHRTKPVTPDLPYSIRLVHDQAFHMDLISQFEVTFCRRIVDNRGIEIVLVQPLDAHSGGGSWVHDSGRESDLMTNESPLKTFLAEVAGKFLHG